MQYSAFHFAHEAWLWGLLAVPAMTAIYGLLYRPSTYRARLERFADRHLLPHLLTGSSDEGGTIRRSLLLWSCIWSLGVLAMAGPRWNYTDLETFKPERNLVVLLDLSRSMDTQDVKPSRLMQAREKLSDLLKMAKGMHIGLVGYAADAHMISPVTDDTKPLLALLPDIDTSLAYVQGNNLKPALEMAARMLSAEPGHSKSILILSDGGWHDGDIPESSFRNLPIYAIGFGTAEGAPIPTQGNWIKGTDGRLVVSRLEQDKLRALSQTHDGLYRKADYTDGDLQTVLSRMQNKESAMLATGKTTRAWEEHFYLPVMLMALLMLPWFRRGAVFPALVFLCLAVLPGGSANAAPVQDWFLNRGQQARAAFEKGDYKAAAAKFDTPYQRGVSEYKAGQFDKAEQSFAQSPGDAALAEYNQGNAQVMQAKYEDAIHSYESVLKRDPQNVNASHNLGIAGKLLQLQQQQQKQDKQSKQQQNDQKSSSGKDQDSNQKNSGSKDSNKRNSGKQDSSKRNSDGGQPQQQDQTGKSSTGNHGKEQNGNSKPQQQADAKQNQKQADKGAATSGQSEEQEPGDKTQPKMASTQPPPNAQKSQDAQAGLQNSQPMPGPVQAAQERPQQPSQTNKNALAQNGLDADNVAKTGSGQDQMMAAQERPRAQKDIDADQWLTRINNDTQSFLKNQFQLETENNGTTPGDQPW